MWGGRLNSKPLNAFSLIELMVVLVLASVVIGSIYKFVAKQRKVSTFQRLKADTESIAQISYFIIGRDIRRAGSNPAGAMGYTAGAEIPIKLAANDQIRILADLDGNGSINPVNDEDVTYQWADDSDPAKAKGYPNQVRRQAGNQLVIENIRAFDLKYKLFGTSSWVTSTNQLEMIRMVRLRMVAGTGRINPDTGKEDTKEIQMDFMLRNFR
jgi:prepilin-type N-terminal cleavage/methylation domain-containing protein